MAVPDSTTLEIWGHARDLKEARRESEEVARTIEYKLDALQANDLLTTEARAIEERRIRSEGRERLKRAMAKARAAEAASGEVVRRVRVGRHVDPAAQARVRRLLDDGMAAGAVLEQARKLGDVNMIAALRGEMLYVGGEGRFHDASDVLVAADRALAETSSGNERDQLKAAAELTEAARPLDAIEHFARKVVEGTNEPIDRVRYGFAIGPSTPPAA